MPLIKGKSKKAFDHNIKAEMDSGKPQDQALAIAYNIQRKNKKKMAQGGMIQSAKEEKRPMPDQEFNDRNMAAKVDQKPLRDSGWTDDTYSRQVSRSFSKRPGEVERNFREDGRTNIDEARDHEDMNMMSEEPDFHKENTANDDYRADADNAGDDRDEDMYADGGMVDIIMKKRKSKMYAEGGEVDLSRNADEDPNYEDDLSFEALKKENYSESDALDHMDQPEDSNLHGRDLPDEDSHDMVDMIRRKIKSKRGM